MAAAVRRRTVFLGFKPSPPLRAALEARYALLGPFGKATSDAIDALSPDEAASVDAVLTLATLGVTREAMAKLPALAIIVCLGSGYEGVDLAAARDRGIVVAHSPGANASSVADLAMGLLIASTRAMFAHNAYLQRGEWERRGRRRPAARGLTGRRIGIYGLGAIGERIARRAIAFEMEVGYYNRRRRNDVPYPYFPSLLALADWADVLMIAVRAGADNRHAVDAAVLRALGADGHVINVARGSVIDEPALIAALRDGTIAGAGLDVFEQEPFVPEVLRAMENVSLLPHIGGDTSEAANAMGEMVLANLDSFFAGGAVPWPVPAPA